MAMCVDHKKSQREAKEAGYLQNSDIIGGKWGILRIFGLFVGGTHYETVGHGCRHHLYCLFTISGERKMYVYYSYERFALASI